MIDYPILQQLVTFYHTGTLVETAEKLHISQSTLTRSMQKLESEIGVSLFIRTKNSIALNETGRQVAQDAEKLLQQTENMIRNAKEFDRKNRTILFGSCAPYPLYELSRTLSEQYPEATISSELRKIPALLQGLDDDTYQLVLLPFKPVDPALIAKEFCQEQLFFLLPLDHRFADRESLSTSDINGETLLLVQEIGFWYDLALQNMPDSRFLLQNDPYAFIELINNSTLPAFTTSAAPEKSIPENRVKIPISDSDSKATYYLVCKKEHVEKYQMLF